ncbi:uncharacterized protein G2W53_003688 [Senna tora]|uniref:Uncharacterized protein n=1 Tax=Senna tora TaxID=362788 RepID=A0A834XAK6_9FABA|nr:uncharacterized protein G2W53_003688 [Senna tora]
MASSSSIFNPIVQVMDPEVEETTRRIAEDEIRMRVRFWWHKREFRPLLVSVVPKCWRCVTSSDPGRRPGKEVAEFEEEFRIWQRSNSPLNLDGYFIPLKVSRTTMAIEEVGESGTTEEEEQSPRNDELLVVQEFPTGEESGGSPKAQESPAQKDPPSKFSIILFHVACCLYFGL